MHGFDFVRARTREAALSAIAEDEEAKYLGGGQTLLPTMKQRLAAPSRLVSVAGIADLQGVAQADGVVTVGAATPHARVARAARSTFPALAQLAGHIGDPAVRNRGTIGGSLANNDPAACYPSAVLACGATVVTDRRELTADAFFQGLFSTALEERELITAVRFPVPERASYQKFVQPASRFAVVGVFIARYADRVGVAVTGASEEGVFRWREAEVALSADFRPEAVRRLIVDPAVMIEDLYGSRAYRAHLVPVLTARAVAAANSA